MICSSWQPKYFGRGKGMVAYALLFNHIPINGYLIGSNDYEGHHVLDIWYRNTSEVKPTAITGDMHSINKANFALHYSLVPRNTRNPVAQGDCRFCL
ncbi:transposase [Buttiauxella gaviniae ATCC 51604]|uniref:Transposase n=1 Tax=Buttiauxella gaviniae ATCC 51604 TaxID=1354253 RepID=A0A1B7HK24_9ENTR|nr:transposase [Buttiauxella gaviniae ATCC 51604]